MCILHIIKIQIDKHLEKAQAQDRAISETEGNWVLLQG